MALSHRGVAEYLLSEGLHLTALELYAELLESGKELKVLKEYFSDASNLPDDALMQAPLPDVHRSVPNTPGKRDSILSPSHGKGASYLDITRSASQMTLDSIDQITRYSEDTDRREEDRVAVLEYELRTSREIISQLRNSIATFTSEERRRTLSEPQVIQEDEDDTVEDIPLRPYEQKMINYLINDYLVRTGYKFTAVTFSDECSEEDFDDWEDIQPTSLISLFRTGGQPPPSQSEKESCDDKDDEITALKTENEELKLKHEQLEARNKELEAKNVEAEATVLEKVAKAELLTKENEELTLELENLTAAKTEVETSLADLDAVKNSLEEKLRIFGKIELENPQLQHEREDGDGASLADDRAPTPASESEFSELPGKMPRQFYNYLNQVSCVVNEDDRLAIDEDVINTLADRLSVIVTSLILAVRAEAIPLILHTVHKHQDAKVRDSLLGLLFNLLKRPEPESRKKILSGLAWICTQQDWSVERTEEEILPHLWQQIENKHTERRQLVAEAVGVLSPYVSAEMRPSLLFSLLEQLVRDSEVEVAVSSIRSLAIVCSSIEISTKLSKTREMILGTLDKHGCSPLLLDALVKTLLPALFVVQTTDDQCRELFELLEEILNRLSSSDQLVQKVEFLKGTLPLVTYTLLPRSEIGSATELSSASSENPTFRDMFGVDLEQRRNLLPELWSKNRIDSTAVKRLQSFMYKFLQVVCPLDLPAADSDDVTNDVTDDVIVASGEFLKSASQLLGGFIIDAVIVKPLWMASAGAEGQQMTSAVNLLCLYSAYEERSGITPASEESFSQFLVQIVKNLKSGRPDNFREQLKTTVRLLRNDGASLQVLDVIQTSLSQEKSASIEILRALSEFSHESSAIDRLLSITEPLTKSLDEILKLGSVDVVFAVICQNTLAQDQRERAFCLVDALLFDQDSCLDALKASDSLLCSCDFNRDVYLTKLCSLPQHWMESTPNFNRKDLCTAFLEAVAVIPQLSLAESVLTSTVLPSLAKLLELIQSNPALQTADTTTAEAAASDSCLETGLLMLMSEVEVSRRRSSFASASQRRPSNTATPQLLQQDIQEAVVDTPQDRSSDRGNVKEKMQKLFQKTGPRKSLFKK